MIGDEEEDDDIVYAAGKFGDGHFQSVQDPLPTSWWQIELDNENKPSCNLKDLGKCLICFGGLPIQRLLFDNSDGFLSWDDDERVACIIPFRGPYDLFIKFTIEGWPKEEWGRAIPRQGVIQYLKDTVARNHPEATARFEIVTFEADAIQGPLKRVVIDKRNQQLQEEQMERDRVEDLREVIGMAVEKIANKVNDRSWLPDRVFNKVLKVFVDCGLHNYKTTDDEAMGIKVDLIVDHLELYREEGLKSLRQQAATNLKGQIENLISQQADSVA